MQPRTLRAHHAMCMLFFRGHGYSEDFTRNMQSLIARLGPHALVRVAASADEICRCCPFNNDGVCKTADKVNAYDSRVLELCGLSVGETLPFAALRERVLANIILPGKRQHVCGNCEWSSVCSDVEGELFTECKAR